MYRDGILHNEIRIDRVIALIIEHSNRRWMSEMVETEQSNKAAFVQFMVGMAEYNTLSRIADMLFKEGKIKTPSVPSLAQFIIIFCRISRLSSSLQDIWGFPTMTIFYFVLPSS
ncbi:MAG: hypothetical protein WA667_10385 [Candidatus Nitrosopolaris sp.]